MKNSGLTLTETIMALFLFSLISGAIYSVYQLSEKAFRKDEQMAEISQNGRVILERIVREIRQAKEIATELPSTNTIEFEDGHTSDLYNYIHYYKEGDKIKREVVGYYFSDDPTELVPWDAVPPGGQTLETKTIEEARVIGEYVSSLNFSGLELVEISLSLSKKEKILDLTTKVFARNL